MISAILPLPKAVYSGKAESARSRSTSAGSSGCKSSVAESLETRFGQGSPHSPASPQSPASPLTPIPAFSAVELSLAALRGLPGFKDRSPPVANPAWEDDGLLPAPAKLSVKGFTSLLEQRAAGGLPAAFPPGFEPKADEEEDELITCEGSSQPTSAEEERVAPTALLARLGFRAPPGLEAEGPCRPAQPWAAPLSTLPQSTLVWPVPPQLPLSALSGPLYFTPSPAPILAAPRVSELSLPAALAAAPLSTATPPPGLMLMSVGSINHGQGVCRPCAFVHSKGCANGAACPFCHLCAPGEKKRRLKEQRDCRRATGSAASPKSSPVLSA